MLYVSAAIRNLQFSLKPTWELKGKIMKWEKHHKMKILNVLYDNIIFLLRDINCHTRIQSMLKSFEKASSSKKTFQNFRAYGLGHIKIELTN